MSSWTQRLDDRADATLKKGGMSLDGTGPTDQKVRQYDPMAQGRSTKAGMRWLAAISIIGGIALTVGGVFVMLDMRKHSPAMLIVGACILVAMAVMYPLARRQGKV